MKDYEKKYKEALERAKKYKLKEDLIITQDIFPELAESEDEKIRKRIIHALHGDVLDIEETNKAIAWLEKLDNPDINPSEFDSQLNRLLKQFESLPKDDITSSLSFYLNVVQNDGTYKEEKQGERKPYGQRQECTDCQFNYAGECKGSCQMKREVQKPAFEMITPEESLGIDSDTYNKIVEECIYEYEKDRADAIDEMQKPWSEEDENCLSTIIAEFSKYAGRTVSKDEWMRCNDFLNSLKERVQPKQEWNEKDKDKYEAIVAIIRQKYDGTNIEEKKYYNTLINWLKSLRPQSQWKPSDKQMDELKEACDKHWEPDGLDPLYTLYQDLKKLREE